MAGPIERPGDLIPQFKEKKKLEADNLLEGLKFLIIGFARKCCIADLCGIYVDNVFSNLSEATSLAILVGAFLFLIQIYNDFAGYSEIALGCAKLLGINLSTNFNFPLVSKSYTEFFRRWHITLNRWFTDYLYIPLGGNRKGKVRKIINTMIVFGLCGLWHGANWTFILWGLVAGIMVSIESLLRKPALKLCNKHNINPDGKVLSIIRNILMILMFSLSSILFRASSLTDIGIAFTNLFTNFKGFDNFVKSLGINLEGGVYLIIALVIMASLKPLYDKNILQEFKK